MSRDYKLPVPEFLAFDDMFRVNLYRSLSSTIREEDGDLIEKFRGDSEKVRRRFGEKRCETKRDSEKYSGFDSEK